jgi:hypothetical protein
MSCQKSLHLIGVMVIILFLVGCGTTPFQPQPDATLTGILKRGEIEIGEAASIGTIESGTINLTISDDGAYITSVSVDLMTVRCGSVSSGNISLRFENLEKPIPVVEGNIAAPLFEDREIKGQFTSPTEARGTIDIGFDIPLAGTCDFGTFNWHVSEAVSPESLTPSSTLKPTMGLTGFIASDNRRDIAPVIFDWM